MSILIEMEELCMEIAGDIHHGECFYNDKDFEWLLKKVDKFKELLIEYHEETIEELE